MENQKLDTIMFRKTALSRDELNRIYKYRNNKIIQWVFLLAVVLLLLVIMISYLTKEFMNNISIEIIWDILFAVCFSKKNIV